MVRASERSRAAASRMDDVNYIYGTRTPYHRRYPHDYRDSYSVFSGASDGRRRHKSVGFSDLNSTGSTRYGYVSDGYSRVVPVSTRARARYSYTPVEPLYGRNTYMKPYPGSESEFDDFRNYSRRARHLWQPNVVGRQYDEPTAASWGRSSLRGGGYYPRIPEDGAYRNRYYRAEADDPPPERDNEFQEKTSSDDEVSEDYVVDKCCCGCVDVVVTSCCWGTGVVTCRCHDSAEESESTTDATESSTVETTLDKKESDVDETDEDIDDNNRWATPRRRPPAEMAPSRPQTKPKTIATKEVKASPKDSKTYEEYSTDDSSELSDSSENLTSVHSIHDSPPPDTNKDKIQTPTTSPRKIFLREKVEVEIEPKPTETTPVVFLPKQPTPPDVKPQKKPSKVLKYIGEKPKIDNYKTAILADMDPAEGPFVGDLSDQALHVKDTIYREREPIIYKPEPEIPPPYKHKPIPPRPIFPLKNLPKREAVMVRVGGGWMNVEHHRKRRIPLQIQEHHRSVTNDKYLTIKSKFTHHKEYIPVAYTKYRDKAVWDKKNTL